MIMMIIKVLVHNTTIIINDDMIYMITNDSDNDNTYCNVMMITNDDYNW